MPGCVLRIGGASFDPLTLARLGRLRAYKTFRAGDSRAGAKTWPEAGAFFDVSDDNGNDLARQIAEAHAFLDLNAIDLRCLASDPSIAYRHLDFGVLVDGPSGAESAQSYALPDALIQKAGGFGIEVFVSRYPVDRPQM